MSRKDETKKKAKSEDVVLLHGRTDDGEGHLVLRKRGDTLALGEVRPMREGKPIRGEVVRLKPRADAPYLADVEVLHEPASASASSETQGETAPRTGPAQVATPAYRAGWSSIFGAKKAEKSSARLLN